VDESGAPAPGITVELLVNEAVASTATTDRRGEFVFRANLSDGAHVLRLVFADGSTARLSVTAESTRLTERAGRYRIEIRSGVTAAAKPPPPPPPPPPDQNHAIVPVFFATDRNRVSDAPLVYGREREPNGRLHLGRIDVSIPRDVHQLGRLERPDIWTFWREDPNKHFVIVRAARQPYDQFYREISEVVGRSSRREAFVFVHGFNVTFESAVYRTAQIAYDLFFDGAPILYSWPSLGTELGYPTDANNSEWTIDHLRWFLEDVAARSGAQYVHLIAHSRGNWPLMNALRAMATEPRTTPRPRFRQIILTAPDVDADVFRGLARAIRDVGERTTLYASANDSALALSKRFQGYQRAGDVTPAIVTVEGLDSIDVSAVDTSFVGHSYYGDNTSVLSDIARLIMSGRPPAERCGIESVVRSTLRYWMMVAKTVCPVG
jgi:esterase/lipase superfamily enzyme